MASPPRPWTEQDEERRVRLLQLADARGVTRSEMARRAGISQSMMSRWSRRKAHPPDDKLDALEASLATAPAAVCEGLGDDAALSVEALRAVRAELEALVPSPPADEPDPLGWIARAEAVLIAAAALKLAVAAKSEAIRLGACRFLADRGWGKPIQRIEQEDPEAPVEAATLMDKLLQIEERLQVGE